MSYEPDIRPELPPELLRYNILQGVRDLLNVMIEYAYEEIKNEKEYVQKQDAENASRNITEAAHFFRSPAFRVICENMPIELNHKAIAREAFKPRKNNLTDRKKPTTSSKP
jgi:hypothetical protein